MTLSVLVSKAAEDSPQAIPHKGDIAKYCLRAQHTLVEFGIIIDLIDQNMAKSELGKKIDVFFYIDQNRQAKRIYSDMKDDPNNVSELYKNLCRVEASVKARWQNDYKFIAAPLSLHPYLIG